MSQTSYRIEALRSNNYDTWKLQAQAVLTRAGLWDYVSGKILKPPENASQEEKEKWEKEDSNAKSELILIISPNELKQIKTCDKSKDIWDTLSNIYESKGPARKASLLKKLILHKMKDDDNVRNHLNTFLDIVDKLAGMDVFINNDLLSIMMLYSLPVSFENFRIAIESRDLLPSPEALKVKILEESEARTKNHASEPEGAFFSKNKYFQRKHNYSNQYPRNRPENNMKCQNCFKYGHLSKNCHSRRSKSQAETFNVEICHSNFDRSTNKQAWCLDSGCTSHLCSSKENFIEYEDEKQNSYLKLASENHTTEIKGSGKVQLTLARNNLINLTNTLHVPSLTTNLMSVSKITDKGHEVLFKRNEALVINPRKHVILKARKENGLYYIQSNQDRYSYFSSQIMEWHEKLGHINENDLKNAKKKECILGLQFNPSEKLDKCETCIKGKFSRLPFPENAKSKNLLEVIHSDVWGPFNVQSPGGAKYYVTFIDGYSRYCKIYFMKHKSEVLEKFKIYKVEVENEHDKKIKYLQSDNGTEYCNQEFDNYLKKCGIQRRFSAPYTPQQNGLAERKNRTLLDKARCLIIQAKLPLMFWAEAINTANYLQNRCPSRVLDGRTPFELWLGREPSARHLHVFGSKAFVLNKKPNRGKFTPRTTEGIFMGYSETSRAYRIWMPDIQKIIISRDVKVIDNKLSNYYKEADTIIFPDQTETDINSAVKDQEIEVEIHSLNLEEKSVQHSAAKDDTDNEETENLEEEIDPNEIHVYDENLDLRKSTRTRNPPKWTDDFDMSCLCENTDVWEEAVENEIRAHLKNETWVLVDKTENKKPIGCKIILKEKYKSDGTLERRKARLVAKGFTQKYGIDFSETYAPVAKLSSIRLLLAVAAEQNLILNQLDVTTAFLNGEIEEEVYMEIPENLRKHLQNIVVKESSKEDKEIFDKASKMLEDLRKPKNEKVCLLNKAIYGLKQAGRQWFKKLDFKLKEIGFKASNSDPCIYISSKGGEKCIVGVYVDDLVVASSSTTVFRNLKEELLNSFDMRDLGKLNYCLGMNFEQNNGIVSVNQTTYIENLLNKFGMQGCKKAETPMEVGLKLPKADSKDQVDKPYQNLIGSLMYLAVATRPDISYAVSFLSQFNTCFNDRHWVAAKRVLRYLSGTKNLGLVFKKTGENIIGYADADWGSCSIDRRSYTGYCFILAGASVSWESRKQRTVALSTAEAEYMSITEASKEAIHMKNLANDIDFKQEKILILNDNQAALHLIKNPVISSKSKHIAIKEHFIRDVIQRGEVEVQYRHSEKMFADVLTKAVHKSRHEYLTKSLGLQFCSS